MQGQINNETDISRQAVPMSAILQTCKQTCIVHFQLTLDEENGQATELFSSNSSAPATNMQGRFPSEIQ
jgi:hypothetical protein